MYLETAVKSHRELASQNQSGSTGSTGILFGDSETKRYTRIYDEQKAHFLSQTQSSKWRGIPKAEQTESLGPINSKL